MKQTLQQDDENTLLQWSENPEIQRSSLKGWTFRVKKSPELQSI